MTWVRYMLSFALIRGIFYKPNKYFHIFLATAPEANDPQQPTVEDVTQCATGANETSGNLY